MPREPKEWAYLGEVNEIRYVRDGQEWVHRFTDPGRLIGADHSLVIRGNFTIKEGFIHEEKDA